MAMKKYLIAAAAMMSLASGLNAGNGLHENMNVLKNDLTVSDGKVVLDLLLDIKDLAVPAQRSLKVTPVLVSEDGKDLAVFSSFHIDGRYYYKSSERRIVLRGKDSRRESDNVTMSPKCGKKSDRIEYTSSVPFSEEMYGSNLDLRVTLMGCRSCEKSEDTVSVLENAIPSNVPLFKWSSPEELKPEQIITGKLHVAFAAGSAVIDEKISGNRNSLDKIVESLKAISASEDASLKSIYVKGYASPDGPVALNDSLSLARAEAVADYLSAASSVSRDMFSISGCGEDWDGLREYVAGDNAVTGKKVSEIMEKYKDADADKVEKILATSGEGVRKYLYDAVYPVLRRIDFHIVYETVDLSSPENGMRLRYAEACAAYEAGNPEEALAILGNMEDGNAEVMNLAGICCAAIGEEEKAASYFKAAASAGSAYAEENASLLDAVWGLDKQ